LVAARVLSARLLLAVFRRRQRALGDAILSERVGAVARRLQIRRRIEVLEAPGLRGPVAFGVWRPTVALPVRFADDFVVPQQEVMLAHELAHLAASDPAWHLLADLVTAVLWWHPAAWWARHQLRAASETAADEASLLVADGPAVLAACLVELGRRLTQPHRAGWVRMAGSGFRSSLGRRVERLVRLGGRSWQPPSRMRLALALSVGAAGLLAAAILSTAWARSQAYLEGDLSMNTMPLWWQRSVAGIVLCTAFGVSLDGALGEDPAGTPAGQVTGEAAPGTQKPKEPGGAKKEAAPAQRVGGSFDRVSTGLQETKALSLQRRLMQITTALEAERAYLAKAAGPAAVTAKQRIADLEASQAEAEAELQAATMPRIRVFRLSHREPEEVYQILQSLLPESLEGAAGGPGTGGLPGFPGLAPGSLQPGPGGLQPGLMTPSGLGVGGGMFGIRDGLASLRLAVDGRTRSLIVRGSERDLQTAADLVTVLDLPPGKPVPKIKNLRAYKLRHANAGELADVLRALELDVRLVPIEKGNFLIVAGPEAAMTEIGETIEQLDVESKPEAK
jgi:hypothetical protein